MPIKARSRARTRPSRLAPSIFQFAVSHQLTLIKACSRAKTKPRDGHRQSSNSLSHTGLCSSKLAVERGTGTVNLPIRRLAPAYAHQSSPSSEDRVLRLAPPISQFAVSPCSSKLAAERRLGLETDTVNLPVRCLTLAFAHQSSQLSQDQASRLAPSISHFAVSYFLLLVKARSRARTRPRDWHHQSPNSLSHTGLGSSKLAVERGPGLETGTINLPIRCLTLA